MGEPVSSDASLDGHGDWVRHADPAPGIEAYFQGKAYGWHRHATYAIGRTLAGVQSFRYRQARCDSLPGDTLVLHPDEPHDGQAGTEAGFRYRMIYVEPALIQAVLGGRPLPFIADAVSADPRLACATAPLLQSAGAMLDPLERDDAVLLLASALAAVAGATPLRRSADFASARRALDYLQAHWREGVTLEALERATGRERWGLSRDFRTFYGTSPHRFLVQRRLAEARRLLSLPTPLSLADVAAAAGFADQSHMTRQFTASHGLAPGRWRRVGQGAGER